MPPDHHGAWITSAAWQRDPDGPLPVLARAFQVAGEPADATLSIAGLGVYCARIAGRRVTSALLEPGYTDYRIRTEWAAHDVTDLLTTGRNVLSIDLGPGCYRSAPADDRWTKIHTDFGDLGACAVLEWRDASGTHRLATDLTWHATLGPVRRANWVGGEDYDAHHLADLTTVQDWPDAVGARMPSELVLTRKQIPPLERVEDLPTVALTEPAPGVYVADFGVNFAGWVELDLPARTSVTLRPAELLNPDGSIDPRTQGWGPVYHRVSTAESRLTWHPQYMYNGLRYLEIEGLSQAPATDSVRGIVIAAGAESAGDFHCSDERLNSTHRIIKRAVTSNMYSMFTDCPQREKLGYLEQLHLAFDTLHWNYDVGALLENTLRIAREAQAESGHLGLYVPEWDPFPDPWRGDVNFGAALVFVPWQLYRAYGDDGILRTTYSASVLWVEHVLASRTDGVIEYGLGDWDGREPRHVPLVATATLARACTVLALTAAALGDDADRARWDTQADDLRTMVSDRFVAPDGRVGGGTVAELAIALQNGVVPKHLVPAAREELAQRILADDLRLDVGEVAMAALLGVLADAGQHDLIHAVTVQDRHPGYGYQLRHGATSLTETWDGPTFGFSQNHFMNGVVDHWFFSHLVGIQQSARSVAYRELVIRPQLVPGVTSARASHRTPAGEVSADWSLDGAQFTLTLKTPRGTRATVELPDGTVIDVAGPVNTVGCALAERTQVTTRRRGPS
ncbi:hypothetical protein EXU48_20585 [Occultella glacieicola]|uniref:alpha-L-rhamnosidase n=1 Tax=Occultella glacieicola TaxID=2518684 RepID=A0ABY2DZS1_9MICO|nr:alpha-L-rhamnosidase [Occultella glacieicola]TDE89562.1 hypothetical protein EXU48_20585 [Occultella glacieicola]